MFSIIITIETTKSTCESGYSQCPRSYTTSCHPRLYHLTSIYTYHCIYHMYNSLYRELHVHVHMMCMLHVHSQYKDTEHRTSVYLTLLNSLVTYTVLHGNWSSGFILCILPTHSSVIHFTNLALLHLVLHKLH